MFNKQDNSSNQQSGENKEIKEAEDIFADIDAGEKNAESRKFSGMRGNRENGNFDIQNARQAAPELSELGNNTIGSERKSKKWIFIAIIFLIAVAAIACVAYYYLFYKIQDNNNIDVIDIVNINKPEEDSADKPIDSDSDGLTDEEEKIFGTNPNSADSDEDGLLDKEEIEIYHTDPMNFDTDGDGYGDGQEIKGGYDPNGEGKLKIN